MNRDLAGRVSALATESLVSVGKIQATCDDIHARLRVIEGAAAMCAQAAKQTQTRCKHFRIEELVPPECLTLPEPWALLDPQALMALDAVRERFGGAILVNTYLWGGRHKYRGYRPPGCGVGAKYSQHYLGKAWDITVVGKADEDVRNVIRAEQGQEWARCIRRVENGTTGWVHFDVGIHFFNP